MQQLCLARTGVTVGGSLCELMFWEQALTSTYVDHILPLIKVQVPVQLAHATCSSNADRPAMVQRRSDRLLAV
jgi:hypothetical protein